MQTAPAFRHRTHGTDETTCPAKLASLSSAMPPRVMAPSCTSVTQRTFCSWQRSQDCLRGMGGRGSRDRGRDSEAVMVTVMSHGVCRMVLLTDARPAALRLGRYAVVGWDGDGVRAAVPRWQSLCRPGAGVMYVFMLPPRASRNPSTGTQEEESGALRCSTPKPRAAVRNHRPG